MALARLLPLLSLIACEGSKTEGSGAPADDTAEPDDTDTPAETGPLTYLSSRVHEDLGTLVYAQWTQESAGSARVEYSFDDGIWLSSPEAERGPGAQEQLLLGIPYAETVTWRVVLTPAGGEAITSAEQSAATDAFPSDLPMPTLRMAEETAYEPTGKYLLTSINAVSGGWTAGTYWKIILDRQGRVVWAMPTPLEHWSIYLRQSRDGKDILWDEATFWSDWDQGLGSRVHRMKIDGDVVETYETPGLHHAFTELEDGTLAWGAALGSNEQLVKQDGEGGIETIWDCEAFHASVGFAKYCQSNSLYWHEPTDTFLFSFYTTSTIVEIDHSSGDNPWYSSLYIPDGLQVDPPESYFSWQHGVHYTDAGTLLLSTEYYNVITGDMETVAREYEVDAEGGTLSEVWSFGEGEGVFAHTAGEAHRLPGGNTLHNYGSAGRLREVTPDGAVVWDVEWPGERLLGRSTFIEDLYDFAP